MKSNEIRVDKNRKSTIANPQSIITLLTDFGTQDYFAGAMKGVVLSINPAAVIVDITHDIPPQDIHAGAFNLLACHRDFPPGTIHVAVVDPGVGSDRRAIVIECSNQFFVGPDNGLFCWIVQREGNYRAYKISNQKWFRHPLSNTFHGRDIFAPVAAALSTGADITEVGPVLDNIVQLEPLTPKVLPDGRIEGVIIHVDHFGNCVTNFTAKHLGDDATDANLQLRISETEISSVRKFFTDKTGKDDELFMYLGSAGFIEIGMRNASAAAFLNARRGQSLTLVTDAA
ncbi:MAG TPA: SAM-dependent chlorinase/fluorinase [Pyrinomonadaceae bacterium]|jgi:S-adenosylmethionine hydrolase|nr:SAM-dependent chlorinase/fluorinase [Pyrinomonadaceae bacterium]